MKNKKQIFLAIVIIILLGANLVYMIRIHDASSKPAPTTNEEANTSAEATLADIDGIPVDEIVNYEEEVAKDQYCATVDSEEQAQEIANADSSLELISYSDGVATYTYSQPGSDFMDTVFGVDTYDQTVDVEVMGVESTVSDVDYQVKLEKDEILTLDAVKDAPYANPGYQEQAMNSMQWYGSYLDGTKGNGATVAIIDTGCDIHHPDLAQNIVGTYNAVDGTDVVTDYNSHGTHVAGIVAAVDNELGAVGVAPEAGLYIIKADHTSAGKSTSFYTSDVARGLNKCVELGYINVVNMSLGSYGYGGDTMKDAMENAADHGILIVCAAGNNSTDELHVPSGYKIGLGVASYNWRNNKLSSFSNYGKTNCDLAAPGSDIYSTVPNGGYAYKSGTSMASPEVAGVAALVYSKYAFTKDRSGADAAKKMILDNVSDVYQSEAYGKQDISVSGGVKVDPIFDTQPAHVDQGPSIILDTQNDTKQVHVTFKKSKKTIWYTTNGYDPTVYGAEWDGEPIVFDIADRTYRIKAVYVDDNGKPTSAASFKMFTTSTKTICTADIKHNKLSLSDGSKVIKAGKSKQVYTEATNYDKYNEIPMKRWTWSTSNKKIATVSKTGKVTVSKKAKSKTKFVVYAKLGGVTKKITLKVK